MNPTQKQSTVVRSNNASHSRKLRGEFSLVARDKSGNIVETYEDKNLIVNLAKTTLASLLGGNNAAAKRIDKIAFGTSSISPDVGDTVITNPISKEFSGVTYPEFNSVAFSWTLDYNEGNGMNISEFGLFTVDQNLFARKTRTAIAKNSDLLLTGVWKIVF